MAAWEDLGEHVYKLPVDKLGAEYSVYLYIYEGGWELGIAKLGIANTDHPAVPVAGRTLNEIKADAESWLKEQGYEITEASRVG